MSDYKYSVYEASCRCALFSAFKLNALVAACKVSFGIYGKVMYLVHFGEAHENRCALFIKVHAEHMTCLCVMMLLTELIITFSLTNRLYFHHVYLRT